LRPEWDTLSSVLKIIYYDQRGCGKSDTSTNYSWIEHLKDLKRIKDYISPGKKVILAGSSWGTNLALLYSIYFPDDIKAIILSGFPEWRGINFKKVDLYNYQLDSISNFKRVRPISNELDSIVKLEMGKWENSIMTSLKQKSRVPGLNKVLRQKSREAYQQTFNTQPSMPELTFFNEITIPALIITGNEYCGYPDWSESVARKIAGSELIIVKDSCHDPWYSNPSEFFTKCIEFIKRINQD
jgi:proline iminopeptidase